MKTILNTDQTIEISRLTLDTKLVVQIHHNDRCGNGHNTFSITSDYYERKNSRCKWHLLSCGQQTDLIKKFCPEITSFLKWHLCSTDGPFYYIDNTIYWANENNLEYARKSAIWPNATLEQLADKEQLMERLPKLMENFQKAVESLGLVY